MVAGVMYMTILCNIYCCNAYAYFLCKLVSKFIIGRSDSDAELNCMCFV